MALSSNTVWEVRTDGDDGNGGGFVSGASGTDRSQQAAAHATLTTASVVNSGDTTIIDVDAGDHTVDAADVGNIFQLSGGTATDGPYEITAVDTGNNRWTMDRAVGTAGQTTPGKMGGAMASLGGLGALLEADTFNDKVVGGVYVRSGAYTIDNANVNTSNGPFDVSNRKDFWIEGYDAANGRGTYTDRPVLTVAAGVTNITVLNIAQDRYDEFKQTLNIKVDGNSETGVNGFFSDQNAGDSYSRFWLCEAVNCPGDGFERINATQCVADNCGRGFYLCTTRLCVAKNCSGDGFDIRVNLALESCLSHDNGGNGFLLSREGSPRGCIAAGNTGDGFKNNDIFANISFYECLSVNNGGWGFNFGTNSRHVASIRNAAQGNTSGDKSHTPDVEIDFQSLSADPFVDAANDDYNINDTAGGGQTLRDVTVTL